MRMSIGNVIKRNMTAKPAEAKRDEGVRGSGEWSNNRRGEYLKIPLRARTVFTPSVLAYANVNLQRKCKRWCRATERLSRDMWLVLTF